jgi:septal ring factor EnvC (AmiA/AmiB activator)
MPNDKEKQLRKMYKELAALASESIERDKQLAKLEAEVKAMRDEHLRVITTQHAAAHALDATRQFCELELIDGEHSFDTGRRIRDYIEGVCNNET